MSPTRESQAQARRPSGSSPAIGSSFGGANGPRPISSGGARGGYDGRYGMGDAWTRQRGEINNRFGTESAMNAYGRFISQQRGSRQLGDMQRGFERQTPLYKSQFGQRGLAGGGIKSGTMQQSMQNYLGDYGRDYGRTQQEITQGLQGYDLNQDNLSAWRQQQMADIEAQKANAIANDAAQLEWLRSMVGGL